MLIPSQYIQNIHYSKQTPEQRAEFSKLKTKEEAYFKQRDE